MYAQRSTPDYTQSSIVHAATNVAGLLAPNTIATIYGVNLAAGTRGLENVNLSSGMMPVTLSGTGVHILVGGVQTALYYASPGQINFLVPADLVAGTVNLSVVVDGISGRDVRLRIADVVPGLFLTEASTPAAIDIAGRPITEENPAIAGQWLTLFATGLGQTSPPVETRQIARRAARLIRPLKVLFDGIPVDVDYAGLAPGYAGLYQINVLIPADTGARPEIRLDIEGVRSPTGVFLPLRKPDASGIRR
jgi:uncharacterized protein (TIGR03437 family)